MGYIHQVKSKHEKFTIFQVIYTQHTIFLTTTIPDIKYKYLAFLFGYFIKGYLKCSKTHHMKYYKISEIYIQSSITMLKIGQYSLLEWKLQFYCIVYLLHKFMRVKCDEYYILLKTNIFCLFCCGNFGKTWCFTQNSWPSADDKTSEVLKIDLYCLKLSMYSTNKPLEF